MNKVILIGRLVRDPELRTTASNISVCSFTVAVDRRFKSEGQPTADFISVIAWRQTAEFVSKYFSKGSKIVISGSIQTRQWDDKDGQRRYATEVVADEVEFGESKRSDSGAGSNGFEYMTPPPAQNSSAPGPVIQNDKPSSSAAAPAEGFYTLDDESDIPF